MKNDQKTTQPSAKKINVRRQNNIIITIKNTQCGKSQILVQKRKLKIINILIFNKFRAKIRNSLIFFFAFKFQIFFGKNGDLEQCVLV